MRAHLIRVVSIALAVSALAFGSVGALEGQVSTNASANLDSLRAELARTTAALTEQVRIVMEANLRQGRDNETVRAEIMRTIEGAQSSIESLRRQVALAESVQAVGAGQIAGVVTNERTGDPIPSAQVSVAGAPLGALSDAEGRYVLQGVSGGTHVIRAQRLGFAPVRVEGVVVREGAGAPVNISMVPQAVNLQGAAGPEQARDIAVTRVTREQMPVTGYLETYRFQGVNSSRMVVDGVVLGSAMDALGQRFLEGLELAPLNPSLAEYFDVESGVLVLDMTTPGAAAAAGVEPGDVLVSVRGRPVRMVEDVRQAFRGTVSAAEESRGALLRLIRAGTTMEFLLPTEGQ